MLVSVGYDKDRSVRDIAYSVGMGALEWVIGFLTNSGAGLYQAIKKYTTFVANVPA